MRSRKECIHCHRTIDGTARLCPYCGANPETGRRPDTESILQSHFPRRPEPALPERVLNVVRARQSIVLTAVVIVFFALVIGIHQFVTKRNDLTANAATAVPLTEVADLADRDKAAEPLPMPELEFQTSGSAPRVKTLLLEPGEIPPPPSETEQPQDASSSPGVEESVSPPPSADGAGPTPR